MTIKDILVLVNGVSAKYSDERKFPRTRKWVMEIVSKIHRYGNIMDVMVQHHPEYVALCWGAMKLVLVVIFLPLHSPAWYTLLGSDLLLVCAEP